VILRVEKRYEDEIGVWKELSMEMITNPHISVEDAHKVRQNLPFSHFILGFYEDGTINGHKEFLWFD